jgi:Protein of unknown function (DUF1592)/Protein of unknown function (DUF1588)/Protein of unknown function (DUF1595)/Protein of unknown function (DUF1587)/Protein of unknown function (DUF1585)
MPVEHPLQRLSAAALLVLLPSFGCTGKLEGSMAHDGTTTPGGTLTPGGGGPGPTVAANVDPGRVGIHRLNNTEYDNTVRDLLGSALQPAAKFLAEDGNNFDNTASALGMTGAQYEKYLNAAGDLMVESLANPANKGRFMTCVPAAAADPCARKIIETFGMQIYRRPLEVAEADRAMDVYNADLARGSDGSEAVGQALRAMLASANFLYRVEYDADPKSTTPHQVSGYEMASRLSYLHWSSMPDAALFDAAKNGKLSDPATLEATVDRMLADGKASAFTESFAGQWLDFRKLLTHSVATTVFPTYDDKLVDAMIAEGHMWFEEFLNQDRPLGEWFTADFNFVNDTLAKHYGMPAPGTGDQLTRVTVTTDQRRGFLGLASFLTRTSVPSRTSPTERGAWVLSELLCSAPPPPPPMVADLDKSAAPDDKSAQGAENVRERLERHRSDPACNGCHQTFDPLGFGLERFDGLGRYRETYGNGDAIPLEGTMPDGTKFNGPAELGGLVGQDPRFSACAASKLYTYALGRDIETFDDAPMQTLNTRWASRGLTLKNLLKEVVVSDAFRFRRGEPE